MAKPNPVFFTKASRAGGQGTPYCCLRLRGNQLEEGRWCLPPQLRPSMLAAKPRLPVCLFEEPPYSGRQSHHVPKLALPDHETLPLEPSQASLVFSISQLVTFQFR